MPRLLGILNLSPDSFSDGGRYGTLQLAMQHALRLVEAGAWGIDVGAVSSNPDGVGLSPEEELARLRPMLNQLRDLGVPISIDTFAPEVQRALASEVQLLNDIRGFPDPSVWPALADATCQLIVMHALQDGRADRRDSDPNTIVQTISLFFDERLKQLVQAGVSEDRLVIDPGMGFFLGSNPHTSMAVLRAVPRLRERFGLPVLISLSRKSFLGALLGGRSPMERRAATLSAELYACRMGAEYIRTHDVLALADALLIEGALVTEYTA